MNELKELITTAVEEGIKRGFENINLVTSRDPNELLTAEQISKETDIPVAKVRQLFCNEDLAVQTYTKPRKVTRKAWNEFINERR